MILQVNWVIWGWAELCGAGWSIMASCWCLAVSRQAGPGKGLSGDFCSWRQVIWAASQWLKVPKSNKIGKHQCACTLQICVLLSQAKSRSCDQTQSQCGKPSMGTYNKGHYVAFCKQFFIIYITSSFKIYLKWGLLFFHKGPGCLCGHMISVGTTQLC